jgi:hypothetical protein
MRDDQISMSEFRKKMRPIGDAAWVDMSIKAINGNQLDWVATLADDDGRAVKVQISPSQATHIIPGLKGMASKMLFATPYQTIDRLANAFGAHSICVVLDTNLDRIVGGRVELMKLDGETFFLRMAAGDALAYATLMGLKVYMTEGLVEFLSDE